MGRAQLAERLLALITPRELAAAIVGDFVEMQLQPAAFWVAVLRTGWALSWRFGFGILAVVSVEVCSWMVVSHWAALPPHGIDGTAMRSGWCLILCAAAALCSLILLGPSHTTTRLAIVFSILSGLDTFFWWVFPVRQTVAILAALVLLYACTARERRQALVRLLVAVPASFVPQLMAMYAITIAVGDRCGQGCNLDLGNTPVLILWPIAMLASGGILTWVLGHRSRTPAQESRP